MFARAQRSVVLLTATILVGALFLVHPIRAEEEPTNIELIREIEAYLNEIDTLAARFIQTSSRGGYAEGEVYIDRPGDMRFEYDPPHTILLLANGTFLVHYDKGTDEAIFLPLWETPLWFLLRDEISLDQDVRITNLEREPGIAKLTLRDAEADARDASGQVTLIFETQPLVLRRWELVDLNGVLVQVSLVNAEFGVEIDPEVFSQEQLDLYSERRDEADERR